MSPDFDSTKPQAYSYLRFSTPEQDQGDSYRRQIRLAEEYAERNGLELNTELTFHDRGVSAYRGKNAEVGRLGDFLDAVRAGEVETGSYLLVESLDRISRQAARRALRRLEDICDAGITVVTLVDEREYTARKLDNDPISLLISLLTFIRANEESAVKARRLRAAWQEKREDAREEGEPLTAKCPAWLELDRERNEFHVLEERAIIVRRIFRETLDGDGTTAITKSLNSEGVDTFGSADHWRRSYVNKILKNKAVVGTHVPHTIEHVDGKRVRKPLEPIEGYFPAVVEEEDFYAVQALKKGAKAPMRGRNVGKMVYNIFGGLGECSRCGGTATYVNKGQSRGHGRYLVCRAAKEGAGCVYRSVPYHKVEEAFVDNLEQVFGEAPADEESGKLRQELHGVNFVLEQIRREIEGLLDTAQHQTSASVARRIRELEEREDQIKQEREVLRDQLASSAGPLVESRMESLREALTEDPMDRKAVNLLMRQVFDSVVIDRPNGRLIFRWHQGGETDLLFQWPEE